MQTQSQPTSGITLKLEIPVKEDFIDDIMSAALEGGINYWTNGEPVQVTADDYMGAEFASEVISRGGGIIITDCEGQTHALDLTHFLDGLALYLKNDHSGTKVFENCDAIDADCIIQYALFGELIYG